MRARDVGWSNAGGDTGLGNPPAQLPIASPPPLIAGDASRKRGGGRGEADEDLPQLFREMAGEDGLRA